MKHLLVDISAHGYGHIAQTAPVLNLLAQRRPGLRITVRSHASTEYLKQRIHIPFEHLQIPLDFGMAMFDAVRVDVPRSLAAYRDYHADWIDKVDLAAEQMRAIRPDLLLANVPYRSLAAAKLAGIPSVAMCCLNWADIYHHYAPDDSEAAVIHAQMLDAYNSAEVFLKLSPAMPMVDLHNTLELACVAQIGAPHRQLLVERSGASDQDRLVMVAMGGIEYRLPMENWPRIAGVRWLVPAAWGVQRDDVLSLESLDMAFRDVLASCDAILTKPGYGTFAEAACAGIPVLYVPRGDWPEAPYLADWLQQYGVAIEIDPVLVLTGELSEALAELWEKPVSASPSNTGAVEVVETLCRMLS
ncbi:MAG: hypothetical protein KJ850_02325 [Gammaproteobacteria bacterium]|nr:hypothetical protein [Gammaproteobacteria bacterium]MBU1623859.1 hypothetical protein [Gammaproteobacteria bacterium]MBU1982076.1 hypothetical protein [Gammaproteobacteria bacterium]